MADVAPRPDGAAGQAAAAPQQSFWMLALRFGLMFSLGNMIMGQFKSKAPADVGHSTASAAAEHEAPNPLQQFLGTASANEKKIPKFPEFDRYGRKFGPQVCTMLPKAELELYVYLSDDPDVHNFGDQLWHQQGLIFEHAAINSREEAVIIPVPPALRANGSVWAHVHLVRRGNIPDPLDPAHKAIDATSVSVQLNRHKRKKREKHLKSLLGGDDSAQDRKSDGAVADAAAVAIAAAGSKEDKDKNGTVEAGEVVNYWKPSLAVNLVDFHTAFQRNTVPFTFANDIQFDMDTGNYKPILWVNEFWLQSKHLVEVNETVSELPLRLSFASVSMWKWQVMAQMEKQWAGQARMGMAEEGDEDVLREMFAETNPVLLGVTFVVSTLHTIFDMLAFKNDVSYWRKKRSLEGLSVRAIFMNSFFSLVILLYLLDNDTSWMILISNAVGVVIEVWKLGKAFTASLDWGEPGQKQRLLPRLKLTAKGDYAKSRTRKYDDIATTHLMYVVLPLVSGYATYSLFVQKHKSYYSWVINSLVGWVYAFGFVMMTPQLFINYKLKSVAHLPWRAMVYKSLNTFIDDLFAFVIKMPLMHRLACFRDDIIFFIFLYQRFAYRVDKSRVNEFGQGGEQPADDGAPTALAQGAASAAAAAVGVSGTATNAASTVTGVTEDQAAAPEPSRQGEAAGDGGAALGGKTSGPGRGKGSDAAKRFDGGKAASPAAAARAEREGEVTSKGGSGGKASGVANGAAGAAAGSKDAGMYELD